MKYLVSALLMATLWSSAHAKPLTDADIQIIVEKSVKKVLEEQLKTQLDAKVQSAVKQALTDKATQKLIQEAVKQALQDAQVNKTDSSKEETKKEGKKDTKKDTSKTAKSAKQIKAVRSQKHLDLILDAEKNAKPAAKKVLAMARKMTIDDQAILPGGCWNYVDEVFKRAGFPRKVRKHVFNGKYPKGPFVDTDKIREGDWLYIINHSYHDIDHSSLFVAWTDKAKKQGLMLSYAGEGRHEPARYRVYDLSHVYKIVRVE